MPHKRTKAQKIRAQYHYAMPANHSFTGKDGLENTNEVSSTHSIYSYDPRYIIQDIKRTAIFSLVILTIQLGLFFL